MGLVGLAALTICACESGNGARIAEEQTGPWTTVCSVKVTGPERKARMLNGSAAHSQKAKAISLAVVNACKNATNSSQCVINPAQWPRKTEKCGLEEAKQEKLGQQKLHRCTVAVEQPPHTPVANKQSEGKGEELACRRARVNACRALSAGVACTRGKNGWTYQSVIARRRPLSPNAP